MDKLIIPSTWLNSPINIIVVGAGGTGSSLITELFQINYLLSKLTDGQQHLNVTVFDSDDVSASNVGRQNFWAYDVGKNKARVLVERFNTFGGINWEYMERDFVERDLKEAVHSADLLITCVDKASVRTMIGEAKLGDADTLWLDTGNDANSGQVVLGHLSKKDAALKLPNVFDLYPQLATAIDKDEDSCSHSQSLAKQDYGINKRVALEGTNLLWQLLRHGSLVNHGSFIDLKAGTTIPLEINPTQWAMMGYIA